MEMMIGVLANVRDEALKRALDGITELIEASETIKLKEDYIMRFSEQMIFVKELLVKLKPQKSSDAILRSLLERVETEMNKAREAIEQYKASRTRVLLRRSVISKLQQSSKEIYHILRLLSFANINYALNIKAKAKAIYNGHKTKELKRAAKAYDQEDHVVEMKHELVSEPVDERRQDPISPYTSNSESSSPSPRTSFDEIRTPPYYFFCTLTGKLMEDPVYVPCGHIFERRAIEEDFRQGNKLCRLCQEKLSSTESLELVPNIWLCNFISEWKEKNFQNIVERKARKNFTDLASRITKEDMHSTNHALQELQALMMQTPSCIKEATENSSNLLAKLADLLSNRAANTIAVLGCLLLLARFADRNKERIGKSGVIKLLLKESKTEPCALEILLELSLNDKVANKIGETTNSIATLIALLENPDVAETASSVLDNLSSNLKFTITMVKFGYCIPFLKQLKSQGSSDSMEEGIASMLKELAEIHLNETAAKKLENEGFMETLTKVLSCISFSSKLACLKCIKKMLAFDGPRARFLTNNCTIPALLSLMKDATAEQQCKQDALELLLSLAETSQNLKLDNKPAVLHKLYSRPNIEELLETIKTSTNPEYKVLLLQFLLVIVQNSDAAGEWIFLEGNTMRSVFSALVLEENSKVRTYVLKLIYRIARKQVIDILVPACPTKESVVISIVTILTAKNSTVEEKSAAAGIISHLPTDDNSIDEILQTSIVLNALHDLMSNENKSNEILENALGALLRCTKHSKLEFLIRVSDLHQTLVQMLSTGSHLAKECAARILHNLAWYVAQSPPSPSSIFSNQSNFYKFPYRKTPVKRDSACSVHGQSCLQRLICLVTVKAVIPLVEMLDIMNSGTSEAALSALSTLFGTGCDSNAAAAAITESRGAWPILKVLERGPLPARFKALELLGKISEHPNFTTEEFEMFKGVLFLVQNCNDEELKSKAKVCLARLIANTIC